MRLRVEELLGVDGAFEIYDSALFKLLLAPSCSWGF